MKSFTFVFVGVISFICTGCFNYAPDREQILSCTPHVREYIYDNIVLSEEEKQYIQDNLPDRFYIQGVWHITMWWYFGDYGKGRMPPKVISVNFGLLQDRMVISSVMVEHYGDATSTHPLEEELKLVHW